MRQSASRNKIACGSSKSGESPGSRPALGHVSHIERPVPTSGNADSSRGTPIALVAGATRSRPAGPRPLTVGLLARYEKWRPEGSVHQTVLAAVLSARPNGADSSSAIAFTAVCLRSGGLLREPVTTARLIRQVLQVRLVRPNPADRHYCSPSVPEGGGPPSQSSGAATVVFTASPPPVYSWPSAPPSGLTREPPLRPPDHFTCCLNVWFSLHSNSIRSWSAINL